MKKRCMFSAVVAASLVAASLVAGTGPALASRDRLGENGMGWQWDGGTATAAPLSADGPKWSNAYTLDGGTGSYVYLRGYWVVPLASYVAQFSYLAGGDVADGDGSPRVSVVLSTADGVETGHVIYLDPHWCPSAANAKGWATTDFFRVGSSCTIHTTYGAFTGTDPDLSLATPGTSAWSAAVAASPADGVESFYSFLIADWEGETVVDRVRFGGAVLSSFGTDMHPQP